MRYKYILMLYFTAHYSLQFKNKPDDGATTCTFILEWGLASNTTGPFTWLSLRH
jgi:hypothetical protein